MRIIYIYIDIYITDTRENGQNEPWVEGPMDYIRDYNSHNNYVRGKRNKTETEMEPAAPIPLPLLRPTRGCPRRGEVWVREGKWRWYAVIFKLVAYIRGPGLSRARTKGDQCVDT